MLRQLDRYLLRTVASGIFLTLLIFLAIYIVFAFVGETRNFGQAGGFLPIFFHVFYSVPANLIFILPLAVLLGTLAALGHLATHSELTAMRASGVSVFRMTQSLLSLGILLAGIMFVFGAFLGPWFTQKALLAEIHAKEGSFLLTPEATWLKDGNDFIFIGRSLSKDDLEGVVRYHFEKDRLASITWAERAHYQSSTWHLKNLKEVNIQSEQVTQHLIPEAIWPELVPPDLLNAVSSNATHLNLLELYRYLNYRKQNGLDPRPYELKIWQIYASSVSVIVLMLMAIPFSFGQLRSASFGFRMVVGASLGMTFFLLDRFFGPMTLVLNWPTVLGAFLPTMIFLCLFGVFSWRLI
jgi:lipopolysaccharide export system permease protein